MLHQMLAADACSDVLWQASQDPDAEAKRIHWLTSRLQMLGVSEESVSMPPAGAPCAIEDALCVV